MNSNKNFYVVIMAGGSGTRLWPLSRKEKPKQFQGFMSNRTMIQETYSRVAKVVPARNIMVSTTKQYKNLVLRQLPRLRNKQLIIEPMARGTAPAITLVARHMYGMNSDAIVATVASDHVIRNTDEFVASLSAALEAAGRNPEKLVTIGINPTYADTSLGYIKMGKEFSSARGKKIFYIDSFVEKPDKKTAEKYLKNWAFLWNAGYFIFSAKGFLDIAKKLMPGTFRGVEKMYAKNSGDGIEKIYGTLPNEPVDTAVAEKLESNLRLVVPSELDWSDIGNWGSLFDFCRGLLDSGTIATGKHIDENSVNCLVHAKEKLVATVGLKDIIVIETDDAILVADRNSAGDVKKIVEKLKKQGKHLYL